MSADLGEVRVDGNAAAPTATDRPDPPGAPDRTAAPDRPGRSRAARLRTRLWRVAGWVFGVAFVALLLPALWRALRDQDWSAVVDVVQRGDRDRIGLLLAGALLAAMVGPLLGMLSWRAVMVDVGAHLGRAQAVRMFCIGFFSKYLPVKGVALVVAVRMGRASGVPMGRMFGAGTLSLGVTVLTGLAVGLLAGVEVLGARAGWLVLALVPIALVVVRPHLLNQLVRLGLRLFRRPAPEAAVSGPGMRRAVALQSAAWAVSGLHLWLLALAVDAAPGRSLTLSVGAFSLATVIGLLVIVAPDGLGVRESLLMAALTVVLPVPAAAVVVVASRLVTTVAEVALGAVALTVAEIVHRRATRPTKG